MKAVALTGGIASGKSTVAKQLAARQFPLLDTDAVAAHLSGAGGRAVPALRGQFGGDCLGTDGGLDRARMRELVFADSAARAQLEAILHPLIREEVDAFLAAHERERCVVAIPLYFELLTYRGRFCEVAAIDCSVRAQRERLIRDRSMAPDLADAILGAQTARSVRLQLADTVISNNSSLDALTRHVERWAATWA